MSASQGRVVGRAIVHDIADRRTGTFPIFTAVCGRNLGMDVIEFIPSDGVATSCKGCQRVGATS